MGLKVTNLGIQKNSSKNEISFRKCLLITLSGLTGLQNCLANAVEKHSELVIDKILALCLGDIDDQEIIQAGLNCVDVIIESSCSNDWKLDQTLIERLVEHVKKFLYSTNEDLQATALSILIHVSDYDISQQLKIELLVNSILLATSKHEQTKDQTFKYLTKLTQVI